MVALITNADAPVVVVGPDRREQWNDFVTRHPHGHFMQLWEWGEVRRATGWRPHYLAVGGAASFEATALVLERAIPGLGTVFYTPRGPLWSPATADSLRTLSTAVRQLARARAAVLWRADPYVIESQHSFRGNLETAGFRAIDMAWSYWNQPKYIMLLALDADKDVLLRRIDRKDRYQIRYPLKHGVTVERAGISEANIAHLHRLLKATAEKKGIAVRDPRWHASILHAYGSAGRAALFLARSGEQPVSAGVSIRMGTRAWLMYLGSDYSAPLTNWALQWDMVSWAVESGCSHYDFRGTATNYPPRPDDKGYGVYQFKKSFGAQVEPLLGYFDLVLSPSRYRALRYAEHRLLPIGERAFDGLAALRRIFRVRARAGYVRRRSQMPGT